VGATTHGIAELVATKAAAPGDDLLSELIAVRDEGGDKLDDVELRSLAMLLLMAGFETTASFIPSGLLALIRHPEQLRTLYDDPSLIGSAVEEMLRYDPTASGSTPRYATEDLSLGGVTIRERDAVIASWAAANRDPRRFTDPDTFDIRRGDPKPPRLRPRCALLPRSAAGQAGKPDRVLLTTGPVPRHQAGGTGRGTVPSHHPDHPEPQRVADHIHTPATSRYLRIGTLLGYPRRRVGGILRRHGEHRLAERPR
jgi:hypothetical protein